MRRVADFVHVAGINLYQFAMLRRIPRYVREWRAYEDLGGHLRWRDAFPIFVDYASEAGIASGQYFHQDLWAARRIYEAKPRAHVDVGSRVDGFVAHVLTFMPIAVVDIRPLTSDVEGLSFVQGNLTALDMPGNSVPSLSSLHAIEHVGLGRYGDALDPDGWKKALRELARVLAPNGHLYLSVPIMDPPRVRFNADRILSPEDVLATADNLNLRLLHFSFARSHGPLHADAPVAQTDFSAEACGMFEFTK
jgi:SAM-dependent methyltransferase